jgi:hypothetical protein
MSVYVSKNEAFIRGKKNNLCQVTDGGFVDGDEIQA